MTPLSTDGAAVVGRGARRHAVAVDAADADRLPAALAARTPRRHRRPRRPLRARLADARAGRPTQARPRARCSPNSKRSGASCRSTRRGMPTTSWRGTARCCRRSRSGVRRPATSSPRSAPRSTSTASSPRRRVQPRCGCAAGSTGWNATREGRLVVVDVKTGKSPVSKDDAQRHAQLAMYQLAIAEGLLPQGDTPGGGRLVYLGKTGAARRHRTRPGPA